MQLVDLGDSIDILSAEFSFSVHISLVPSFGDFYATQIKL